MRSKLSYANVTATSALVLALSIGPAGAHVTRSFRHLWDAHIAPILASEGVVNSPDNPVDWTKLKNVPSEIADGDDSVGPPGRTAPMEFRGTSW